MERHLFYEAVRRRCESNVWMGVCWGVMLTVGLEGWLCVYICNLYWIGTWLVLRLSRSGVGFGVSRDASRLDQRSKICCKIF